MTRNFVTDIPHNFLQKYAQRCSLPFYFQAEKQVQPNKSAFAATLIVEWDLLLFWRLSFYNGQLWCEDFWQCHKLITGFGWISQGMSTHIQSKVWKTKEKRRPQYKGQPAVHTFFCQHKSSSAFGSNIRETSSVRNQPKTRTCYLFRAISKFLFASKLNLPDKSCRTKVRHEYLNSAVSSNRFCFFDTASYHITKTNPESKGT